MMTDIIDYRGVGNRIRTARIHRDMTQEELAGVIDVTDNHVCNVENGHSKISLKLLINVAKVLEVSPEYLLQDSLEKVEEIESEQRDAINYLIRDCDEIELNAIRDVVSIVKNSIRKGKAQ